MSTEKSELAEAQRKLRLANKALHDIVYALRPGGNLTETQLAAVVAGAKTLLFTTDPPAE